MTDLTGRRGATRPDPEARNHLALALDPHYREPGDPDAGTLPDGQDEPASGGDLDGPDQFEGLGAGVDSWEDVDGFARILVGPAWLFTRSGEGEVRSRGVDGADRGRQGRRQYAGAGDPRAAGCPQRTDARRRGRPAARAPLRSPRCP